jgi:hypothetical protein
MSDPATSTIFGGNTGVSYEDLVRRQAIAQALASQTFAAPKTFGEGLYSLGSSLASALEKRYDRQLAQQQIAAGQAVVANAPKTDTLAPPPSPPPPPDQPDTTAAAAPPPQDSIVGNFPAPKAPQEIVAAIAANTPDPVLRAYAQTMAGREGGPTGSGNYFQWQPATAEQYGVTIGDPDSEAKGMLRLTADNRRVLDNGLPQTSGPADWAAAHQQGAGTVVKMINGTGNASAGNLTANRIDPNLPGPQAVAAIKKYYYPNGDPVDPNSAIAATLAARPQTTPPGLTVTPLSGRDGVTAQIVGPQPSGQRAPQQVGNAPTPTNIQPAPANVPAPPSANVPFPNLGQRPGNAPILTDKDSPTMTYWGPILAHSQLDSATRAEGTRQYELAKAQLAAHQEQLNQDANRKITLWDQQNTANQEATFKAPAEARAVAGEQRAVAAAQREAATPKVQEIGGQPVIISPAQGAGAGGGAGGGASAPTPGTAGGFGTLQVPPAITKLDPLEQQKVTGLISMLQAELQMSGDHKGKTLTDPGPWGRNVIGLKGPEYAQPSLMTPEFSQDYSGAVRWANALRGITAPKSGGAIGDDSLEKTLTDFFPRPNDTESVDAKFARRAVTARSNFDGLSEQAKQKYLYDAEHNRFAVNPDDPTRPLADGATADIDGVKVISKNGLWVPQAQGGQ